MGRWIFGVMADLGSYRDVVGLQVWEEGEEVEVSFHEMFTSVPVPVGSVSESYVDLVAQEVRV